MATKQGGLEVLTETFKAENITRDLVDQVRNRGMEIAYEWLKGKADMGDRDVTITVDNKPTRVIENWRKSIRLSWGSATQLRQLVDFIYSKVVAATPRKSGALAEAWQWSLNGAPIPFSGVRILADHFALGDQLLLFNLKPYVRRANQVYKKPRGIVGPVARAARSKFKGFYIAERWVEIPGHVIARGIRPTTGRRAGYERVRGAGGKVKVQFRPAGKTDQRIPCIVIMKARRNINVSGL